MPVTINAVGLEQPEPIKNPQNAPPSYKQDSKPSKHSGVIMVIAPAKRQTIFFFSCVGLAMLSFGSALTWYGAHKDLPDLIIVGSGLLIIGIILLVVAAVFISRSCLSRMADRKLKRKEASTVSQHKHLEKEYFIANNEKELPAGVPSPRRMYGQDNESRGAQARRATVDNIAYTRDSEPHRHITEMYEQELGRLPPPDVTLPSNTNRAPQPDTITEEDACYTVPFKEERTRDVLPGAAVYKETTERTVSKPPLPPGRQQSSGEPDAKPSSASSDRDTNRGRRLSGASRNKVSPSPPGGGVVSRSGTPLSKSGVELELEVAGMDVV